MTDFVIDIWQNQSAKAQVFEVLPDGCQDVIITRSKGPAPQIRLSPFFAQAQWLLTKPDASIVGFRLAPGTRIDLSQLASVEEISTEQINEACSLDENLSEALQLLATSSDNLARIASDLGVSERSLQRHFARNGLPSPKYWHQLARVRRAGVSLISGKGAAETAADLGYSDQAHMVRSFRHFFGQSPRRFLRSQSASQLFQPGFATGEQISTKIPSGSLT